MADLKAGTKTLTTDGTHIDSVLPVTITVTKTLIIATDHMVMADPSGGDIDLTLPDAASNTGVEFIVKRVENGPEVVKIIPAGADTIDGGGTFILGNSNEYVTLISDGTVNWRIISRRTFAAAALLLAVGPIVEAVTTGYTTVAAWDFAPLSTPGRIIASGTTNDLEVIDVQSSPADIYRINFSASIQYQNNVDVDFAVFVDGVETSVGAQIAGNGANDIHVNVQGIVQVAAPAPKLIEIRVKADSANNITYQVGMSLAAERIGG